MLTIRTVSTIFLFSVTTASGALGHGAQINEAREQYRAGNLNGALQRLEPLLEEDDLDQQSKQRACELAARILQLRGEEHLASVKNSLTRDTDHQTTVFETVVTDLEYLVRIGRIEPKPACSVLCAAALAELGRLSLEFGDRANGIGLGGSSYMTTPPRGWGCARKHCCKGTVEWTPDER